MNDAMTQFVEIVGQARANRIRREVQNNTAHVLAHVDGDASANSTATRTSTDAEEFYQVTP